MVSSPVRSAVSVVAVVLDAPVDLGDRLVDPLDRLDTVAALVGIGGLELGPGKAKVVARGHHVRLIGPRPAGDEAGQQQDAEGQHAEDSAEDGGVRLPRHEEPPILRRSGIAPPTTARHELAESLSRPLKACKTAAFAASRRPGKSPRPSLGWPRSTPMRIRLARDLTCGHNTHKLSI